jgi:hypothetical protein
MTRQDIDAEVRRQAERLLSQQRVPTAVKIGRVQNDVLTQAGVTGTITVPVQATSGRGGAKLPLAPRSLTLALRLVDQAGCLRVIDTQGLTAYEHFVAPH